MLWQWDLLLIGYLGGGSKMYRLEFVPLILATMGLAYALCYSKKKVGGG